MNMVKTQVQRLIEIVNELESELPGRYFTLDGHFIGNIGEVMVAYYYGIELYTASNAEPLVSDIRKSKYKLREITV